MLAFEAFWHIDHRSFQSINDAIIVLLPKCSDPKRMSDYRPISFIPCIGKLFSKVLANRLVPRLNNMVHPSQSAFIKGRSLQDNFQYVQATAKALHAKKHPSLLLKFDIAKAFDTVAWPFLVEIMTHLGFPQLWRDWVASILINSSTRVSMNGAPGHRIFHAQGLRQGDPLSPMLFVLVMEVLSAMIRKADEWALFNNLGIRNLPNRASLYADDLVMFLSPNESHLCLMKEILSIFKGASGLASNLSKCQASPIRCSDEHLQVVAANFPCIISEFPMKYLGIPLSVTKLPKSALQPLLDQIADHLPAWKGRQMNRSGCLVLIKTTLAAVPIHTAISLKLPPWFLKAFQKIMKAFL